MLKEAPGAINFTMFLTLISEKISCIDPEEVILNAFSCFDEKQTGDVIYYVRVERAQ